LSARALRDADELTASVARAMTGEPGIYASTHRLFVGEQGIATGATHHDSRADGAQARGCADAAVAHLWGATLKQHPVPDAAPELAMAHMVYGVLCQFRDEHRLTEQWPGTRDNLDAAYAHWVLQFKASLITETQTGLLLFAVIGSARALINDQPIGDEDTDIMEGMRADVVAPQWGGLYRRMRRARSQDAPAYAEAAWAVALGVAQWLEAEAQTLPPNARRFSARAAALLAALLRPVEKPFDDLATVDAGDGKALREARARYRVFTTRFDQERNGQDLVRAALLPGYRAQIDEWLRGSPVNIAALAERLRRRWAVPVRDGWALETESGYLSAERLSLLVTSPQETRVFKQERHQPAMSAAVTVLLDCSGSMRNHQQRVVPMVELLLRVFERAGVQSEVLGFTTASWNGGQARKAWERAGRPDTPGRVAERLHMVFKSAQQSRRAASLSLAALLKPDLYREGLDGEAVQWAVQRLMGLSVSQRLLIVVSDGSPMETTTQRLNSEFYLDHHLREVLRQTAQAGQVAVMGLGLGLDLSVYYRHCLGWDDGRIVQTHSLADVLHVGFEAQRALLKRR
jgi:cobaltochelatase CobT